MSIFESSSDLREICASVKLYFQNHSPLSDYGPMSDLELAIDEALSDNYHSTYDAINDVTDLNGDLEAIRDFYENVIAITNSTYDI